MTFKPQSCPDRWYGLLAMLGLAGLAALAVRIVLNRPVDGLSFLLALLALACLLVMAYIGYRTVGAFTLQYWIDRDAVTLVWGPTRQIVPIGQVQRIVVGNGGHPRSRPAPWHWPCPDRRRILCQVPHGARDEGLSVVNSYATRPLAEQLLLVTADESYGVSPANPQAFLEALQARYALGVARPLNAELVRPPLWTWPLWRDRTALALIGIGLLGVLVMFGALCFRYPLLSSDLPLHFDASGMPDRIVPKSGLFILPIIGLIAWGFNTIAGIWLYRRVQQGAAYLLWGGALAVQAVAGLALFNLMRW